jgi:hypothetical protein
VGGITAWMSPDFFLNSLPEAGTAHHSDRVYPSSASGAGEARATRKTEFGNLQKWDAPRLLTV